ncbi:MAG: long-chain fatty acid--CoA ligase, partial [Acidimicrobiia bacterium]|nr:long-chain fatty acid--CoA ligase [Acidimicrobiia bacterium]
MATAAEVRAEIDSVVEGRTIAKVLARNASEHPGVPAIHWREDGIWKELSWAQYRERVVEAAAGFISLGVGRGDFVALMAANRPEHVIADLGAMHAAATPVTLYSTLATPQIAYIGGHCEARVAVLENLEYMKRWESAKPQLPNLEYVVLMEGAENYEHVDWVLSWDELAERGRELLAANPGVVDERAAQLQSNDIATLIYTSGTTGTPKGVVITHHNVLWTVESTERTVNLPKHPRLVSFLPLAHIAERVASHYLGMWYVGEVWYCPDMTQVLEYVQEAKPTLFVAAPRVYERFQAGLMARLESEEGLKKTLAMTAIKTGEEVVRLRQAGQPVPFLTGLKYQLLDRVVLTKILEGLGMGEVFIAISTAAPIAPELLVFFQGIGLPLFELWGMSELSGPGTTNLPGANKIGTVGKPLVGTEVKLADDGELMMRGGNVTAGYFKRPEDTAETFLSDGWLVTGDIAEIDQDGFVSIVDRKKELIITAGGKNIAPTKLEGAIKNHPLIGQVCVIGDRRKFLSALIVLDGDMAPPWAERQGLKFDDMASFSQLPEVRAEVQKAVDEANEDVARVEQLKKFIILPNEWTPESDELTPTLKLKRRVIHEKYADAIDSLY